MINIPFNFDPLSSSIKTGAFNVPANQYAHVINLGESFTIGGSAAGEAPISAAGSTSGGNLAKLLIFTNNTPFTAEITAGIENLGVGGSDFGAIWVANPADTDYTLGTSERMSTAGSTTAMTEHYIYGDNAVVSKRIGGLLRCPPNASVYRMITHGDSGDASYDILGGYDGKRSDEFWVPTGTALNGSRYLVMLYKKIS